MGLQLPYPGNIFLPEVPNQIRQDNPDLYDWAQRLRQQTQEAIRQSFDNSLHIATAINLGISGTFAISSGGSIVVTSGIVITVTS